KDIQRQSKDLSISGLWEELAKVYGVDESKIPYGFTLKDYLATGGIILEERFGSLKAGMKSGIDYLKFKQEDKILVNAGLNINEIARGWFPGIRYRPIIENIDALKMEDISLDTFKVRYDTKKLTTKNEEGERHDFIVIIHNLDPEDYNFYDFPEKDLTRYQGIKFKLKGEFKEYFPPLIKLQFVDNQNRLATAYVSLSPRWQEYRIDFKDFEVMTIEKLSREDQGFDWTKVTEFQVIMEEKIQAKGTFYFQGIEFYEEKSLTQLETEIDLRLKQLEKNIYLSERETQVWAEIIYQALREGVSFEKAILSFERAQDLEKELNQELGELFGLKKKLSGKEEEVYQKIDILSQLIEEEKILGGLEELKQELKELKLVKSSLEEVFGIVPNLAYIDLRYLKNWQKELIKISPDYKKAAEILKMDFRTALMEREGIPHGEEIPQAVWAKEVGIGIKKPGQSVFMDYGINNGVPLGGLSGGAIQRSYNGDFNLWTLDVGEYQYEALPANQFSVFIQTKDKKIAQVLNPGHPQGRYQNSLSSWNWDYPAGRASYYALYPQAWTIYQNPEYPLRILSHQISPVIPGDYNLSSLPTGVFEWILENPSNEEVEVSLMFSWQNILGWDKDDFKWRNSKGNYNLLREDEKTIGIVMRREGEVDEELEGEMSIATLKQEGVEISYDTNFKVNSEGREIWDVFSQEGRLRNNQDSHRAEEDGEIAGALAVKIKLKPGEKKTIPFALSWDLPIMRFGQGTRWYQYYTKAIEELGIDKTGKDGDNSFSLAKFSLVNYKHWQERIDTWQKEVVREGKSDTYVGSLFNQLYYLVLGGSAWENGLVDPDYQYGLSLEELREELEAESEEELLLKLAQLPREILADSRWRAKDNPIDYKFALLENPDWKNYSPLDIHYYSSFPLLILWPELEKQMVLDFLEAVTKNKGIMPHDLHAPEGDPWLRNNFYPAAVNWKDLGLKYVLLVWRDFFVFQDKVFLKKNWEAVKLTLERYKTEEFDPDRNGLPDHYGYDTTYDRWPMDGESAYTGSLILAALKAAEEMAKILEDREKEREFKEWFLLASENYEKLLWNGSYYDFYHREYSNDKAIMADQLAGVWYSKLFGLGDILPQENIKSVLRVIYENNFKQFAEGKIGIVNGFIPGEGVVESFQQSREAWVGINYALASLMLTYGMEKEAREIMESLNQFLYQERGYWFRVPEAVTEDGNFRGTTYLRPLSIWALEWVLRQ
ncbi:MAG: GH116 family glycosyl hydrolase, partial [Candidatus Omnitrophica bacterium]|nr:GH116 family glycosyl hydrolase [Candidatus Omnitrophota bacterium]